MSKKKWLGLILGIFAVAYLVYRMNWIPQYTDTVNYAFFMLTGTYNTSPVTIIGLVGGTITTITTGAKLLYDRGKSGVQGTYNMLVGEKDRQFESLFSKYNEIEVQKNMFEGQFTAAKSELTSIKAQLTQTQQKLADVTTELRRKTDQAQAMAEVKIGALSRQTQAIKLQTVMKELDPSIPPAKIVQALEAAGYPVDVE